MVRTNDGRFVGTEARRDVVGKLGLDPPSEIVVNSTDAPACRLQMRLNRGRTVTGSRRDGTFAFRSAASRALRGSASTTDSTPGRDLLLIRTLVLDYEHAHTAFGIAGNLLFVVGSALMLIGSVGNGLRRLWEHREQQPSSSA